MASRAAALICGRFSEFFDLALAPPEPEERHAMVVHGVNSGWPEIAFVWSLPPKETYKIMGMYFAGFCPSPLPRHQANPRILGPHHVAA
jgi:hypothetical protein